MNPRVDQYLSKTKNWRAEISKLRTIMVDCQLMEYLKWGKPCYEFQKKNIVAIMNLKEHCVLLFFKGSLLKDPHRILIQPTENTQSMRQLRFTSVQEITDIEPILKSYINEAIEAEKAGLKVKIKKITDFVLPEEFQNKLDEMPELKTAFASLTPGRQRAYIIYFSSAKQAKTRTARVDKYIEQILDKKGMDD